MPDETRRWLEHGLAGVVLFARNIPDAGALGALCKVIRDVKPDALIALDEEGGGVTRLEAAAGSSWPGARALGVVDDLALTGTVAATIANELAGPGANVNLAPVADVLTCRENPVIGNRSFGPDPALVSRHVAEWVRSTQAAGVAACAKHFPGHGATSVDSHIDLPVVDLDRGTLLRDHVAPFRAAMDAGVAMFMTAHVLYRGIDERPATLSRTLLEGLARRELGFEGVIVTDALNMGAIAGHAGVEAGAVQALAAGADLLCVDGSLLLQQQVMTGIGEALRTGDLSRQRLEEAAERVTRLAARFAPRGPANPGDPEKPAIAVSATSRGDPVELGHSIARRAVRSGPLPSPLPGAPFVVELDARPTGAGGSPARMRLVDALRRLDPAADGLVVPVGEPPPTVADLAGAAAGRPLVVATRDAHRKPEQARFVAAVVVAFPRTVVVALGSEADAELAPGHAVAAFGGAPPNLIAAAEALLPGPT